MNNSNDDGMGQREKSPGQDQRIDITNYVPDPSKRNELKRRLYDSGISNIPMPSVKRPLEQNISSKPYSAKMNPNKIQSLSAVKNRIDGVTKNIYSNLQDSYKEAAAQDAKYKGEGTAEYYKSQHVTVPPPKLLRPKSRGALGSQKLLPRMAQTAQGPRVAGMASTNKILLNKCAKPNQLPSLSDYGRAQMGGALSTELDPNLRLLQGPPAMAMAGFEGGYSMNQKNLELARSKFLLDKLTNKLPQELRQKNKLPPLSASGSRRELPPSRGSQMSQKSLQKLEGTAPEEEEAVPDVVQQKWSDLDKYIELLLDSKSEEETVFVYLIPNPGNSDPYDLQVSDYSECKNKTKYYTLSGKGLTYYEQNIPIEFISLGQWLIERDSYNHIKELDFFKKFKKWKFMRMWKKTIKRQQRVRSQNLLEEKLFMLQDHFSHHLSTHRKYMIDMENKKFVDPCTTGETKTIVDFVRAQKEKTEQTADEIEKFSVKCRENIRLCISSVLSELRTRIVSEIALDEQRKKNNPIQSNNTIAMKRKESSNVFEKLGFPEGMTYGHRSSLRKECSRFLRFAYLIDFLSLEALANIYIGSVQEMITRLKNLDEECDIQQVLNTDFSDATQTGANRGYEPIFYVQSKLCDDVEIPPHEITETEIEEFVLPPRGTSKAEDFDLLGHLQLEEEKDEDEEEEEFDPGAEENIKADPIMQQKVENIENYWLKLDPSLDDYKQAIVESFDNGLRQIKSKFERWGKHHDLLPYANALEEWDPIVGDSWEEPEELTLDPNTWIAEHPLHVQHKEIVTDILDSAFRKMKQFLRRFQPILEIYWRNKQFDHGILVDERLRNPVDSLTNTITVLNYYNDLFASKLPNQADIGLIQLDAKSARSKIAPTPKEAIKKIESDIPAIIRMRYEESRKWLVQQSRNLDKGRLENVEEFVEQTRNYNYANDRFQDKRDRVDLLRQMLDVMQDQQLTIRKEDTELQKETMQEVSRLAGLISQVEGQQDQQKEIFKKDLNQMIPKLETQINELFEESQDSKFLNGDNIDKIEDMLEDLRDIEQRFKEHEETAYKYNKWQETLETQQHIFENLDQCREELSLRCEMWRSLHSWQQKESIWYKTPFQNIEAQDIKLEADKYFKTAMKLEKNLDPNVIQEQLKSKVETFKEAMPIVIALRNDKLQESHWQQIKDHIGKEFDITQDDFTLEALIALDVNNYREEIVAISVAAEKEHGLRMDLDKLENDWRRIIFPVEMEDRVDSYILKDLEEIYTALDESLALINAVLGSRYVKPLRDQAETWKKNIMTLSDMVDQWVMCQKNWMYLENIYVRSADIKKAMVEETRRFEKVDGFFRQLMQNTNKQPNCLKIVKQSNLQKPTLLQKLIHNNEELDYVQKRLEDYMETKRKAFPRFYFLSNDELIDILANSQNMDVVQGHLKTCFDNIVSVDLQDEEIQAMNSNEKEKVPLRKIVKARGQIEMWLDQLQQEMISTLSHEMKKGLQDYEKALSENPKGGREQFVLSHYGQIVACIAQIMWCTMTAQALEDMQSNPFALQEWYDQNEKQLEGLTELVRGNLDSLQRKVVVALVTTDVHARDIVDELKQMNVQSIYDFKWMQQLRYYWDEEVTDNKNCKIKQVSAVLNYGYEYMGATSRLVITPLTDRCWITISNALHIKLGANPAGPAGTGKTESTKDLAKAIACQCIVFNCSDQVDYIMMGRLFSGLCQQGCWTCLDEFNRIDIEVLSVIAQQLLSIRKALLEEKEKFTFEDQEIPLKVEFGCHVTMNPGYAGRTELPDNLKVLFRPVAMMIPNYGLIAEIMLFAEGFGNAKILSTKMVQLYKLSSEQLSQQDHYDFGLRAVKSVLVMAGSLKRANPDLNEDGVLIRAMRDANVPKFLKNDLPLFAAIIQDLFPTVEITENDYGNLEVTIKQMILDLHLQTHPVFILKVIQLFETFNVRFGVMLVGPTGSGKTTVWNVLQNTMTFLREQEDPNPIYQLVKKVVLNPKAISMGEMYGEVNQISQEWFDGLASKEMRKAAQETGEERTWIVFDGPVDALWIENMNTVLDDNMTLCLANGQRIKLRSQMRMLFEVQDLAVASPATVSRCGMVYLTPEELGWRPYVQTWVKTYFNDEDLFSEFLQDHMYMLFDATVDIGIEFIRTHCSEPIKTTDLQQVVSICNFLESFMKPEKGFVGTDEEKKKMIDCIFAWSFAWGLGGSLEQKYKDRFDSVVRDQFKSAHFPQQSTVFDYFYDMKRGKEFKPWTQKVAQFQYDKDASYFDLMVPTQDTTKHTFILETLLEVERPIFFTGNSGVGKSAVISNMIATLKEKGVLQPIFINMSAQTTSARTQQSIEEKLEKKKRTLYGAPPGKKIAIFVDDINMPAVEEYGAQPPIELLRLFVDRKGMYERGAWTWKDVADSTLIACAAPPSGGRAVLTPRFSRRFNMICLPEASTGTLQVIFCSILNGFLSCGFADKVKDKGDAAILSTIEIYNKIQEDLRPTPAKFHYLFNLRDVSKVVQGLCMTKPISISNDDVFMRLWVNECMRVFYDRLINDEDRAWFKNLICELLAKNFKMAPEKDELFDKLKFGDLLKLESSQNYEYITPNDRPKLIKGLHGSLDEYNLSMSNKMNLVLFDDAIEHILRISRVLKQPRGHIMLIGVGGSGKQSLIRLSAFMRSIEYRSIELTKGFNIDSFKEFMKELMKKSGIELMGISFVMTDTQIIDEAFIENLNNLLNTGEIPNLWAPEDKDEIQNGVRPICVDRKIPDSMDNINALFINLVREKLHICLCMSPVGDTLRIRCRQFPSLVNCCTLDWFSRWPEEALLYVSSEFLKDLSETSDEVKEGLATMCMKIHTSVEEISDDFYAQLRRRVYTTPKSYLDLISLYLKVLEIKRTEFQRNKQRLANGLRKLNETNTNIAELNEKLTEMKPKLEAKNEELKVALVQVNKDKEVADEKEKVVSAEAEIVNKKAEEAKAIADDAEADLALAKPELQKAENAVRNLEKSAIVEIKNFASPPEGVKIVMECVMVLLQEKIDWKNVKSVLQNVNEFMNRLLEYDVEKISEKVWKKARDGWINKPSFDPNEVKKISVSAAALCTWAKAVSSYQIVVKKVAPKKAKLAEVKAILASAQAELKVKQDSVAEVKATVAKLEAECQQMQNEKEELEFNMDRSSKRMARAEKLVVLLADEGVRWKETVEVISGQIERLVGNVFLSCACISYFGAFTGTFREKMVAGWVEGCQERNIPTDEKFSLVDVMGDPVVIRNWNIAGLPNDQTSSENGILTMKAERYALCIDPQQQANKWLKNMYKESKEAELKLMKFGTPTFLRDVIAAVRIGNPILVEDLEEQVDPAVDPILLKQQYKNEAGIWQIRLGDSNVDFDDNFNLFMTTKMPNPHYIPEICIKVTLINFTVTFEGLQQQLLGDVVIAERPEVEKQRDEIVLTMAADAKTLKDLENNILKLLSEATLEQILDEDTLIEILEDSKKTSGEINVRMADAKEVEVTINETRNTYTSVAIRGSVLYFVIADLSGINAMYQNSLVYVKFLFNKAIAQSPAADTVEQRMEILIDRITRMLYTNISRGLFEADKLIYSFLISTSILRQASKIDVPIWNIFLRGPSLMTSAEAEAQPPNPDSEFLGPSTIPWDSLYSATLRSSGQFEGLATHVVENWAAWKEWAMTDDPFAVDCPGEFPQKISYFDKLMLIKAFRPELVQQSMGSYIIKELGQFFIEPPISTMDILYNDIDTSIPLIYVLTVGADPTALLLKFVYEKNFQDKFHTISLGQGQGIKAQRLIDQSTKDGSWVMLQNCHLAKSWMPQLEKIVLNFSEEKDNIHEDFRLFLTSMPAEYFPVAVLQNSVKLTTEPPRGMRANLKRSYGNLTQEYLEDCLKPEIWRKLLFALAFFHAIVQERRKFGPLGWNIRYEFNDSDLETSNTMLKLFLDSQDEVPWDALLYITGHINYGGRVTDDNDRICLISTLSKFTQNDVLKENYKFSKSGLYYQLPDGNIQMYRDYIEQLPLNDNPEIFGLNDNANIKYQSQESLRTIETVLSIQPREVGGAGGMTPDEIVIEKSKELLDKLPAILEQAEGSKELFVANALGIIPSLSTVLLQEMEKFNRLLTKMKRSLTDIDLAIKGFIVMSDELDKMYLRIQNNQQPFNWMKVSYPSLKPLSSWFADLVERVAFMENWLKNGNPNSYSLPYMFFPQGFLTGVLQTHARQYKIAIDKLEFTFEILEAEGPDQIDQKPEDGVYIYGLFIESARWDAESGHVADSIPGKMVEKMPVIHFIPKEDFKIDPEDYAAPLYKTSLRAGVLSTTGQSTNFVLYVAIPTKEPPDTWVQRATALLCMLDD